MIHFTRRLRSTSEQLDSAIYDERLNPRGWSNFEAGASTQGDEAHEVRAGAGNIADNIQGATPSLSLQYNPAAFDASMTNRMYGNEVSISIKSVVPGLGCARDFILESIELGTSPAAGLRRDRSELALSYRKAMNALEIIYSTAHCLYIVLQDPNGEELIRDELADCRQCVDELATLLPHLTVAQANLRNASCVQAVIAKAIVWIAYM
jgi:hypothetical protein